MINNKLTDGERISNATLIRLILWADEHKSHYVAAALRELQEYRNAQQVVPSKPTESDIPSWLNGEKRLHWLSGAEWMHNTFCAAPQPLTGASQAALDVLAERQRQVTAEGWTTEHDDEHVSGELAQAASTYAAHSNAPNNPMLVSILWPFEFETFKPCEPRRALVKAGALILAEIERLDRLEVKPL
ncbi:hypothetical protein [Lelliottia wanjuensis]|uniref:hypothetical protein n=1 Tax=Lelliottia wanjuensis TaxID=3050585 RepID=UPI00254C15EF|nr:hypothetical protein [Lelliottia sp. V86_10]MDK9585438.1 hypothetical protein [Lelliottia sp. V86_10]